MDKRQIFAKFCNHHDKKDVISATKPVKPVHLYFSENLTPQRPTLAYALRKARKEFPTVVAGKCTQNDANYVWLKPTNGRAPGARNTKHKVSSYTVLSAFCNKTQKKPVSHFVTERKHWLQMEVFAVFCEFNQIASFIEVNLSINHVRDAAKISMSLKRVHLLSKQILLFVPQYTSLINGY